MLSLSSNSLLHIQAAAFPGVAARLASALRPGGAWYMSFELGEGERLVGGRLSVDHTEARFRLALEPLLRAGAHQQLKQELGLGHSEGRSWTGLRRHALMACIAFAYLQHPRFEAVHSRGKRRKPLTAGGPPPQPSLPAVRRADMARLFARLAGQVRCPRCYREAADGARP